MPLDGVVNSTVYALITNNSTNLSCLKVFSVTNTRSLNRERICGNVTLAQPKLVGLYGLASNNKHFKSAPVRTLPIYK